MRYLLRLANTASGALCSRPSSRLAFAALRRGVSPKGRMAVTGRWPARSTMRCAASWGRSNRSGTASSSQGSSRTSQRSLPSTVSTPRCRAVRMNSRASYPVVVYRSMSRERRSSGAGILIFPDSRESLEVRKEQPAPRWVPLNNTTVHQGRERARGRAGQREREPAGREFGQPCGRRARGAQRARGG